MISDILLASALAYSLLHIRRHYRTFSLMFLSFSLAFLLKHIFDVPRSVGLDPLAFPSIHASIGWAVFFSQPNALTFLFALLVSFFRILEGYHSIIDILGGAGTALLAYLLYTHAREADRQSLHIGFASLLAFAYAYTPYGLLLSVSGLLLSLLFPRIPLPQVEDILRIYDRDGTGRGLITLLLGSTVAGLSPDPSLILLLLAWGDGLPAMFGREGGKSFQGFMASLLGVSLVAVALPVKWYLSLLTPILEYLLPEDNLSIPLSLTLFMYLFP